MTLPPPPLRTPLVILDPKEGVVGSMTRQFYNWFLGYNDRVNTGAYVVTAPSLTAQAASIGTTALVPTAASGQYRVSWYLRVTTAATTSSSIAITIGSTESSIALTQDGAAVTGNLTTSMQSGSVIVSVDAGTPITYATTYASVGGTAMQYRLTVLVEAIH